MKKECPRCGYQTKTMSNLRKHLNKIKPCNPLKKDIKYSDIEKKYFPKDNNHFACNKCGRCYEYNSSRNRHQSNCGKVDKIDLLQEQLKNAVKEIEKLKKQKPSSSVTNNNNNTINNNITINAYGTDKFTPSYEELGKLLTLNASRLITKLINDTHFNPNKPENVNFYISNYKDNIGRVYDGKFWGMKDAEELVEEVFNKFRDTIDEMIYKIQYESDTEEEIEEKKQKFFNKIQKLIENWERDCNRKNFDDNMKIKVKQQIYSKKDFVTKSIAML
jgi:hypothetical protein